VYRKSTASGLPANITIRRKSFTSFIGYIETPFYLEGRNKDAILGVLPEELRKIFG
jgi:hypothetical protein